MASCVNTKSVPSEEKCSNTDEFSCVVCAEVYKNPTLLHCMHTFCGKCIEKLVEVQQDGTKTVSCPNCRFVTKVCVIEMEAKLQLYQSDSLSFHRVIC